MKLPLLSSAPAALFAIVLFLDTGPANAQATAASSESDEQIEEIVVREQGSRLPASAASFPGSVTMIDQAVVEQQAAFTSDVATILAFEVPGFATSGFGSSNFRQRLRGRKVAVYIDGIPVSAPLRDAGRDIRALDVSAIGGIEVIRGSTALYGNGGAGGSINYLTKRPSGADGWRGSSQLTLGSSLTHPDDSYAPLFRQNLEIVDGAFDFLFTGSYESYDGFFDAEGDRIPPNPNGNGGVAESTIFSAFAKAGYNWEDQRLEASYLRYDQDQDSDYLLLNDGDVQAGIKAEPVFGQVDPRDGQDFNVNDVAQVSYIHGNLLGGEMRLQYYYQSIDQQFRWNPSRGGGSNSRIESEKDGLRLDFDTPLDFLGGGRLLWGAEYATDTSEQSVNTDPRQTFVPPLEQTDTALFAQLQIQFTDRLSIQGGVRYDDLKLDLADFTVLGTGLEVTGGTTSYDSTVFNLGATFDMTDEVSLFGGFSQGFSLPDVGRVLRSTTDTNPLADIKPEPIEIDNYELGMRVDAGDVSMTFAGWFNTSELGERFSPDPNSPPGVIEYIVSRQAQDFWGVEATITGSMLNDRARWGGSYTWVDGEQDTDDDGTPDGPIGNTSIPPIKVTAFMDYDVTDDWNVRVQALFSGDRNAFPEDAFTSRSDHGHVRSSFTLDASTRFKWGPGEASVGVSNLLNRFYFPAVSYNTGGRGDRFAAAPGATARIGYVLAFD